MAEFLKTSGRKIGLPNAPTKNWKFTTRPGGWIIAESPDGRRHRMMLFSRRNQLDFSIGGRLFHSEIVQARHESVSSGRGGESDLTAQFPGKVRKIIVSPGSKVKEGEALLLVEAMKMEFSIKAPSDGVVTKILVTEGQQLSPGDRFFEFEAFEVKNGP